MKIYIGEPSAARSVEQKLAAKSYSPIFNYIGMARLKEFGWVAE